MGSQTQAVIAHVSFCTVIELSYFAARMRLLSLSVLVFLVVSNTDAGITKLADKLEKHLKKLTKKDDGGDDCVVVWEEQQQSECKTEYAQDCEEDVECNTVIERKCSDYGSTDEC